MRDSLRFPYVPMKNVRGEGALRPWMPFTLTYHGKSINVAGLLDTGADVNVLPYQLGVALGAIWSEQSIAVELSGNLANYDARGLIVAAAVGQFAPVQLAFAWTRAENVPLLLGQVNFFAEFDVCFYRSQSAFDVRPKGRH